MAETSKIIFMVLAGVSLVLAGILGYSLLSTPGTQYNPDNLFVQGQHTSGQPSTTDGVTARATFNIIKR